VGWLAAFTELKEHMFLRVFIRRCWLAPCISHCFIALFVVKGRSSVVLIGESLGDPDMLKGLPEARDVIKIGFLSHNVSLTPTAAGVAAAGSLVPRGRKERLCGKKWLFGK